MTIFTSHLSRRHLRATCPLLLAALIASTTSDLRARPAHAAGAMRSAYGYPVKPFDRQHPIRGGFGDPRTVFLAPPTRDGVYRGRGSFSFHQGGAP
jgi:hypothetical protein